MLGIEDESQNGQIYNAMDAILFATHNLLTYLKLGWLRKYSFSCCREISRNYQFRVSRNFSLYSRNFRETRS